MEEFLFESYWNSLPSEYQNILHKLASQLNPKSKENHDVSITWGGKVFWDFVSKENKGPDERNIFRKNITTHTRRAERTLTEITSKGLGETSTIILFCYSAFLHEKAYKTPFPKFLLDFYNHTKDRPSNIDLSADATVFEQIEKKIKAVEHKNTHWLLISFYCFSAVTITFFVYYSMSNSNEDNGLQCISELTATLNSSSERTPKIDFNECKSTIFEELKSPKYTAGYDFTQMYRFIGSIIEVARKDENRSYEDLSDLYLFSAIYAENMNLTLYIKDVVAAYKLNQLSLAATSHMAYLYHKYGHDSFKYEVTKDSYWNYDRFPWEGNKVFFLESKSDFIYLTGLLDVDSYKDKYESIKDNTDYYSVIQQIWIVSQLARYFYDLTLLDDFKIRHGECQNFTVAMLSAACFEIELIEAYKESDSVNFHDAYQKGRKKFEELQGFVGEANFFREYRDLTTMRFDIPDLEREPYQAVEKDFENLIRKAITNKDKATALDLNYRYANIIVGDKYNNQRRAQSILNQVFEESEQLLGLQQLLSLEHKNGWRELHWGDTEKGLKILESQLTLDDVTNDTDKVFRLLGLYKIYAFANKPEKAQKMHDDIIIRLNLLWNTLPIDELHDFVGNIIELHGSYFIIEKLEGKNEYVNPENASLFIRIYLAFLDENWINYHSILDEDRQAEFLIHVKEFFEFIEKNSMHIKEGEFDVHGIDNKLYLLKLQFGLEENPFDSLECILMDIVYKELKKKLNGQQIEIESNKDMFEQVEELWIAEVNSGNPEFYNFQHVLETFLNNVFAHVKHGPYYEAPKTARKQRLLLNLDVQEFNVEVLQGAIKLLKFIVKNTKGFVFREVDLDAMVVAAVISDKLGDTEAFNYFTSEAFERFDNPNYSSEYDSFIGQLIILRSKQLMLKCNGYLEALSLLDKYENFFKEYSMPVDSQREFVFQNKTTCN
ncbi:MAG: hypothetical protein ABJD02_19830 [Paraglaciecola sp.]|uniref:hypothetical protein n=2 Tax=Paraglaciecola sp. TaxID=1920173 RepID=UPI0032632208